MGQAEVIGGKAYHILCYNQNTSKILNSSLLKHIYVFMQEKNIIKLGNFVSNYIPTVGV